MIISSLYNKQNFLLISWIPHCRSKLRSSFMVVVWHCRSQAQISVRVISLIYTLTVTKLSLNLFSSVHNVISWRRLRSGCHGHSVLKAFVQVWGWFWSDHRLRRLWVRPLNTWNVSGEVIVPRIVLPANLTVKIIFANDGNPKKLTASRKLESVGFYKLNVPSVRHFDKRCLLGQYCLLHSICCNHKPWMFVWTSKMLVQGW